VKTINNFVPKTDWKIPPGGKRHSCEDNIKKILKQKV
jgi:hypothetical protein